MYNAFGIEIEIEILFFVWIKIFNEFVELTNENSLAQLSKIKVNRRQIRFNINCVTTKEYHIINKMSIQIDNWMDCIDCICFQ